MEYFADYFVDPDGVFYDLGSGIGKLVSHVALGSTLSKVCGIELDKVRHSKAQKLVDSLNFPFSKPDLINDDFLNCNYSDATIIYFDNTMWNDELTEKKDLVFKLFETIRPGVLIISKMEIPHVSCHKKYIRLENSYSDEHGLASIFLSMST
jgi:predicted RNA methylase